MTAWLQTITAARRYGIKEGRLQRETLAGKSLEKYIPVAPNLFRAANTGLIELALTTDPLAGPVLVDENFVGEKIPRIQLFAPWVLLGVWLLAGLGSFLFAPVWIIRLLAGYLKKGPAIRVRLWPLLAGTALALAQVFLFIGLTDMFAYLGHPTLASVGFMSGTIVFALLSGWSVVVVFQERRTPMNRWNYWYAVVLSVLHLATTVYLLSVGFIGLRTWA